MFTFRRLREDAELAVYRLSVRRLGELKLFEFCMCGIFTDMTMRVGTCKLRPSKLEGLLCNSIDFNLQLCLLCMFSCYIWTGGGGILLGTGTLVESFNLVPRAFSKFKMALASFCWSISRWFLRLKQG